MKTTWKEYYTTATDWEIENLSSLEIINLMNHKNVDILTTNIIQNNNLVILTIDGMDQELMMLHHFTQIGGSLRMKEPKLVALNGFGAVGSVVRFKPAEDLFSYVETRDVPKASDFDTFGNKTEFNALSSDESTKGLFRNFVFLPPYMVTAFLSISSREPGDLAYIASAAAENLKINYDGHPEFNDKNYDETLKYILTFLWCC